MKIIVLLTVEATAVVESFDCSLSNELSISISILEFQIVIVTFFRSFQNNENTIKKIESNGRERKNEYVLLEISMCVKRAAQTENTVK